MRTAALTLSDCRIVALPVAVWWLLLREMAHCKGKHAGDVVGRAIRGLAFYGWLAVTAVDERASWMVTTTTRSSASMTTYTRINHRHGPRMNR
jgi:hypothetical protein